MPTNAVQQRPDRRLERARAKYARKISASAGPMREALERALARVPRERFLGPPPWYTVSDFGYVRVRSRDPARVYRNALFALDRAKGINNGEPALHAQMIGALEPRPGDLVVHIGCGTGYYSAVIAELVGAEGRVVAYEIDPDLAQRALDDLEPWPNVTVRAGSGTGAVLPSSEGIYVNAGASRALAEWLDALKDDGRLVFPLVTAEGSGVTLKVWRRGDAFAVEVVNRVRFIHCAGALDEGEGAEVARAIRSGQLFDARSLHRNDTPDASAVLVGEGWWLSDEVLAEGART